MKDSDFRMPKKHISPVTQFLGVKKLYDDGGNYVADAVVAKSYDTKRDPGFSFVYMAMLMAAIDCVGNKKMDVLAYILQNMDSNNLVIKTTKQLAEETHTSIQTVTDTLKALEGANVIARHPGVIKVNPMLCSVGNAHKYRALLLQYEEFGLSKE